jgi:hypothetical protein
MVVPEPRTLSVSAEADCRTASSCCASTGPSGAALPRDTPRLTNAGSPAFDAHDPMAAGTPKATTPTPAGGEKVTPPAAPW